MTHHQHGSRTQEKVASQCLYHRCGNVTSRREIGKPKRRCASEGAGVGSLLGWHMGCSLSAAFSWCVVGLPAHFAPHAFVRPMCWFCLFVFQLFQRLNGGRLSCDVHCVVQAQVAAYEQPDTSSWSKVSRQFLNRLDGTSVNWNTIQGLHEVCPSCVQFFDIECIDTAVRNRTDQTNSLQAGSLRTRQNVVKVMAASTPTP